MPVPGLPAVPTDSVITDPLFYLAAVPAVLFICVTKGAFGVAMGVVAVPVIALTLPIGQTAGILLPVLLLLDGFGLWIYWRRWDGALLRALVPGALLGVAAGTATFHLLPEQAIRLLIGGIAVGFTLQHWLRRNGSGPPRRPPGWVGLFAGGASGFTSFVSHAGAPPLAVYLLPQRLDKTLYTGTTVLFFALVNGAKLPAYAWLGLLARGNLATAAALSPLVPLGIVMGARLHRALSPQAFYRVSYAIVFLAGLKLMSDGLLPWLR